MTKDQILKMFLDEFQPSDHQKDCKVTLQEFIDYYSVLSASMDKDVYFDYALRQAWKL